jgi:hypothetical protein
MNFSTVMFFFVVFALGGCVSVSLGGHSTKHASGVAVAAPKAPFKADSSPDVDAVWKDTKNGNLISYLSDCQDDSDPTLETVVQGALEGLSSLQYESNVESRFQEREARRVMATGKVDGVPTKVDLLVFKRNECIYILTYVGVVQSFSENHEQFEHFLQGFHAP